MGVSLATPSVYPRAMFDGLLKEVGDLNEEIVEVRRAIHRDPELGIDNPRTQQKVLASLAGLGLSVSTGSGLTSVVADLEGVKPGPTILLRADTDALPMTEEGGEAFASQVEGVAHTCGHDAHTAMLIGAAKVLASRREELAGRVRFMFQPGEEGVGGAPIMIREGVLEGVDAAFALHITPNLPTGWIAAKPGPVMAAADEFTITITGRGAHASTPHFGNDPIPVACELVTALQTFVTRRVDAFNPAIVTVGRIEAGTTHNIIPERAVLQGTIRSMSEFTRMAVHGGLERIARGVASAHECEVDIQIDRGYPVTVNTPAFVEFGEGVARQLFDDRYFELPMPIMGAEDFSFVLNEVPGAMFFLGACPADISDSLGAPSCHSNLMRLNEDCLALGAAMHVAVATTYLSKASELGL